MFTFMICYVQRFIINMPNISLTVLDSYWWQYKRLEDIIFTIITFIGLAITLNFLSLNFKQTPFFKYKNSWQVGKICTETESWKGLIAMLMK